MQTGKKGKDSGKKGKRSALGKGLSALLPDNDEIEGGSPDYFQCDVDLITPNRYQPRIQFQEDELKELSDSILEQGIIQPLLVRSHENGYELIAGERRLRAAKLAGLTEVPAVVKDITDRQLLEMSIVENVQREDLNPMEESDSYQRLMSEFDLTQEQVSERVGKSRPAVANFLRLQNLPDQIKDTLRDGVISMGHARALLGAETLAQQSEAWRAVVAKGLSVRDTENLVKKLKAAKEKPEKPEPGPDESWFADLAEDLSVQFGTKVKIARSGQKGKVEIEFYNNDDLDRLIGMLREAKDTSEA